MEKCYSGISVPQPIEEPCGNNYISTDCVKTPTQIIYLDLPAGTSQTEINKNLTQASQTTNQAVQDLDGRVSTLEGGSGGGSGGAQDLQSVLDNGSDAIGESITLHDVDYSFSNTMSQTGYNIVSNYFDKSLNLSDNYVSGGDAAGNKTNTLFFNRASVGVNFFFFPDKPDGGDYTLATTDDLPTTGDFSPTVINRSDNISPINTWAQNMYWSKVNNLVTCSVEISAALISDASAESTWIVVNLPFPVIPTNARTNTGNGVLIGGSLSDFLTPAFAQLDASSSTITIQFRGKPGDTSSSYQGEVHFTYLTS